MLEKLIPLLALCASVAVAQTSPVTLPALRLRGTIEKIDADSMTLRERSGETIALVFDAKFSVAEVVPIELSAIQPGAFIGSAAMPQPDGTLQALEVTVFPESARGRNEGSYAWDLQPGSTMTNATVADLVAAPQGRTMKLKYKDGEKTLVVPAGVPIVTFKPGDRSLLVPGARVSVTAEVRDGKPTALRVQAGRNGFVPPT